MRAKIVSGAANARNSKIGTSSGNAHKAASIVLVYAAIAAVTISLSSLVALPFLLALPALVSLAILAMGVLAV